MRINLGVVVTSLFVGLAPAAADQLLPVKVGDFHIKFNEMMANAQLLDIKAVPGGCRSETTCTYRVGEHSIITVSGTPDGDANYIHINSSARSQAQSQMVFSTIVALTELAAPERTEGDRRQVVGRLLQQAQAVWEGYEAQFREKSICEELGGHWEQGPTSGGWKIIVHFDLGRYGVHPGDLDVHIEKTDPRFRCQNAMSPPR
jgi:hypothetical protein